MVTHLDPTPGGGRVDSRCSIASDLVFEAGWEVKGWADMKQVQARREVRFVVTLDLQCCQALQQNIWHLDLNVNARHTKP